MKPNDHLNNDANSNSTSDCTKKKTKIKNLFIIGRLAVFRSSSSSNTFCGCGLSDVHDPSLPPLTSSRIPPSPASSINILATLRKHPNSPAASTIPGYADDESEYEETGYNRRDLRTDSSYTTSMTATTTTTTATACSSSYSSASSSSNGSDRKRSTWRSGSVIGSSIAVVKDSEDPYCDFRDSMMRMVEEKGIYSRSGLEELLKRFLELNSPCYHSVIVRAFTQIWNQVVVGDNVSHHAKHGRR